MIEDTMFDNDCYAVFLEKDKDHAEKRVSDDRVCIEDTETFRAIDEKIARAIKGEDDDETN